MYQRRKSLTISYCCTACGAVDEKVEVPSRYREEPLNIWMANITRLISNQHTRNHLFCDNREMTDVKIPYLNRPDYYVGMPVN